MLAGDPIRSDPATHLLGRGEVVGATKDGHPPAAERGRRPLMLDPTAERLARWLHAAAPGHPGVAAR
jgi:hypothetical protein